MQTPATQMQTLSHTTMQTLSHTTMQTMQTPATQTQTLSHTTTPTSVSHTTTLSHTTMQTTQSVEFDFENDDDAFYDFIEFGIASNGGRLSIL